MMKPWTDPRKRLTMPTKNIKNKNGQYFIQLQAISNEMSQNQKYNKKLKHDKVQYKTSGGETFNCLMYDDYNDYNAAVSYISLCLRYNLDCKEQKY